MQQLKNSLSKQQEVFDGHKKDTELVKKLSLKISKVIAEKHKSYSEGELNKNCQKIIFIKNVSPEKKDLVEQTCLSRFTVDPENIKVCLEERKSKCPSFSIALTKVQI